jgi:hypothetical protein
VVPTTAAQETPGTALEGAGLGEVTAHRVEGRGWGPTILLCMAVVLAGMIIVVGNPLSAGAASTPKHAFASHRAHKVSLVTPGVTTSPNWSGYVASARSANNGSFSQVSAQWVEPAVTCPKKDAWTLFWVGFDGWPSTDRSVEQGGTSAQCVGGQPRYSAFYEMWPTYAVTTMFTIYAGDQITASVNYSAASQQFLITVSDTTAGHENSQTKAESCPPGLACARSSAEWIAESPSHFGTDTWFPLANYGTVDFTTASATDASGVTGPISDSEWVSSGIERVAGRAKPLAKVSGLENSGSSSAFSDTWHRSGQK